MDGLVLPPCKLFDLRQPSPGVYRIYGRVNGDLQEDLCQGAPFRTAAASPHPHSEPLPTYTTTGAPPTLAGGSGSVAYGITIPFSWVLVWTSFCLCPPKTLFAPVLWQSYNQIFLAINQSQIPWGFLVPLPDLQTGKPDMGLKTFTTVGELLWYYCSPVYRLPTWPVWDLILS